MTIFENDKALLQRFKDGDKAALHLVYQWYAGDIESLLRHGFTHSQTGQKTWGFSDIEEQKELLQEIFIRAFSKRARHAYDGLRPYRAFILTIAKNVMIDFARKSGRDALRHAGSVDLREQQNIPQAENTELPDAIQQDEGSHWDACIEVVRLYLQTATEMERQFILERFVNELPQRDVAQKLRITRWGARRLEKRILAHLKQHLKGLKLWP